MNPFEKLLSNSGVIEERLGYVFQDKNLLALSFVHRSFINEYRDLISNHNERLEFLGDSVLNLLVSGFLYRHKPEADEGELSRLRSSLVDASGCILYLKKLELEEFLLLGKGEQRNVGKGRDTILADLFEALLGAIYLDGGLEGAARFFFSHFEGTILEGLQVPSYNYKAEVQDYSQKNLGLQPKYVVEKEEGPDHAKEFLVAIYIGDKRWGEGRGRSKKEAEQEAAKDAKNTLGM